MSRGGGTYVDQPSSRRPLSFSRRELVDLTAAWGILGVAFALFLDRRVVLAVLSGTSSAALTTFAVAVGRSLLTVGVAFLLHELAHKIVAVRFEQVAEFRADYNMLAFALLAAMAGFLFAAPGAVVHQGRITPRENGLIALAGPVTNLLLAAAFLPLVFLSGFPREVGNLGIFINLVLAGFNMIPFGPLDGRTVLSWNPVIYTVFAIPSIGLPLWLLFG